MKKTATIAGGVLALLLLVLLVGPALIDWNRHKDDILTRVETSLGRDVDITGDVSLRLLPSPAFVAHGLRVANLPGGTAPDFARAETVRLKVALWPLLKGEIAVKALVLDRPRVSLERLADGRANWQFEPAAEQQQQQQAPAQPSPDQPSPDQPGSESSERQFSIDRLQVTDGTISYRDGEDKPLTAERVELAMDMASLSGPFAGRGSAVLAGRPLTFQARMDRMAPDRGSPLAMEIRLPEAEAGLSFDGLVSHLRDGTGLRGRVELSARDLAEAAAAFGAGSGLPAQPLKLAGTLNLARGEAVIPDLNASLGDHNATGKIEAALDGQPRIEAALSMPRLDLNAFTGGGKPAPAARPAEPAKAERSAPSGGTPQEPANPAVDGGFTLPKTVFANVALAVDELLWKQATLRQARLEATLDQGEVMISQLAAQLPGNSSVAAEGNLVARGGRPAFDGQMAARTQDLPALLAAFGTTADRLPRRLEATGALKAAWPELELSHLSVTADGVRAQGSVGARLGDRPSYRVDAAIGTLNLDQWLGGAPAAQPAARQPVEKAEVASPSTPSSPSASASPARSPLEGLADLDATLALRIDQLIANGIPAQGVRLDATLANGELKLRQASAADLGGARAQASGALLGLATASPRVENLTFELASSQPAKLFRFLGVDPPLPPERLGQLAASGRLDGDWTAIRLNARANGGGLELKAEGSIASPLAGASYDLAVTAGHASFAQFLRLFSPDYRPRGTVGALAASARVKGDPKALAVSGLDLRAGPIHLTGQAAATLGGKPVITAELAANAIELDPFLPAKRTGMLVPGGLRLGPMPLPAAFAAVIPVADGLPGPWTRDPIDLAALKGFDARVGLKAESLTVGDWRLAQPVSRLVVENGTGAIESLTGKLLEGDLTLSSRMTAAGQFTGELTLAGVRMGDAKLTLGPTALSEGRLDAQWKWSTSGRSTHDLAQKLSGDGRLLVKDGVLTGFDLPAVNRQLNSIENVGSLLGLAQAGMGGGTTRFSQLAGTFRAQDGVIVSRDLRLDAQGGSATGETAVNLPRWVTDTRLAFHLAEGSAPPLVLRLEGPLDSPRKVVDVNELQRYLVSRGLGRSLKGKDAGSLVEGLLGGRRSQPPPAEGEQPSQEQKPPTGKDVLRDLFKGLGGR